MSTELRWPGEWLEADGQGGFAMGTAALVRTRRYHALLLTAFQPPTRRMVLVSGVEAWAGALALSANRYAPGVTYPPGQEYLVAFGADPWPCWRFERDEVWVEHELFVAPGSGCTVLRWRGNAGTLTVRPLLAVRDDHALRREGALDLTPAQIGQNVAWRPGGVAIGALSNGAYEHGPQWFRNVLYPTEQARGMDCIEDVASPGTFTFDLAASDAVLIFRQGDSLAAEAATLAGQLAAAEHARRAAPDRLARSATSYVASRAPGRTIMAGFPWFTD